MDGGCAYIVGVANVTLILLHQAAYVDYDPVIPIRGVGMPTPSLIVPLSRRLHY